MIDGAERRPIDPRLLVTDRFCVDYELADPTHVIDQVIVLDDRKLQVTFARVPIVEPYDQEQPRDERRLHLITVG